MHSDMHPFGIYSELLNIRSDVRNWGCKLPSRSSEEVEKATDNRLPFVNGGMFCNGGMFYRTQRTEGTEYKSTQFGEYY